MTELGPLMDLLVELEEAGVKDVWTDGFYVHAWPQSQLSLRLKTELRRNRREPTKTLQRGPANPNEVIAVFDEVTFV
jgi:hypothetical protein